MSEHSVADSDSEKEAIPDDDDTSDLVCLFRNVLIPPPSILTQHTYEIFSSQELDEGASKSANKSDTESLDVTSTDSNS